MAINRGREVGAPERYLLLKVAQQHFGCGLDQLSNQQLQEASRIAYQQTRIEDAILRSQEAIGVVVQASQVEDAWKHIAARYEDSETLRLALDDCDLNADHLRPLLARELKVEAVLERVSAGLAGIDDIEVSLYYFSHQEQFVVPAVRYARHILITINPDFAENRREAAFARIQAIAKRLSSKPERFAEQALKHSECPTSLQGGRLGKILPGTLYPELEDCLFALEVGAISGPVESPLGFHLLLCEASEAARRLPLEDVLPRLREKMQVKRRKAHQRQWLEHLLQTTASCGSLAHEV
jgi:peptidyl-prolyl cis-trans isomerase C